MFGRWPFTVSKIRPTSSSSVFDLWSVLCEVQPKGFMCVVEHSSHPLFEPLSCMAMSISRARAYTLTRR
ncbi:hypothetical protein A8M77_15370 [Variovorax sp. JS1663]|nr:hypothetical protein A8M77_15370 [Variovorax sp. JS1663]